ncbi:MAG TPA: DUF6152 family protein [Candidatus Acidoferrales bacterium]|nr:DUF6152 family protein [Candidatus Acidoferrales bacterium]
MPIDSAVKKVGFAALMLAGLIAAAARTAGAHHGFAVFDTTNQKTIVGTVKEFQWTNPHTWVWLDVPNDKGGVDTWGFEGMSPNFLGRRGWSRSTLKPGDKITVTYFALKDGSKGGAFLSFKRPNGEELSMWKGSPTEDN